MAPTPLLTLLQQKLSSCLMQGTSISESGLTVSTDKLSGEVILFFRIDSAAGRSSLGMEDLKVCDCLVFYATENEQREMLCFLELKAAGLDKAAQQILSVYRKIKLLLETNRIQLVTLKACVCMRHQVPLGDLRYAGELKRVFGPGNVHLKFGTRHYQQFGIILRSKTT